MKENGIIRDNNILFVETLLEGEERTLVSDTSIDICIGTVDLLIKNKYVLKNVDAIFSININDIIAENPISLSIMVKMLSEVSTKRLPSKFFFGGDIYYLQMK